MNKPELFRLIYCSRNRIHGNHAEVAAELDGILVKSRVKNSKQEVTGALLYDCGNFAQVLEGSLESVESIFESIQCDPRHSEVIVIESGPAEKRLFPNWAMGFTGASADDFTPQATAAFQCAFAKQQGAGHKIVDLLRELVVQEHEWILVEAAQ